MEKGPKIGLDKVYVAALSADTGLVAPSWGAPQLLSGAAKLTGNPNGNLVTDWGDNGPFFVTNSRGNLQATLELIDVDPVVLAQILGQTRANGITQEGSLDQAPWYALGFRVWIGGLEGSEKIYEYFWYLKGKFTVPEQGAETKKESISPQHTTLSAEFAKLNFNDVLSTHARTNGSGVAPATITNWFNAPVYASSFSGTPVTFTSGVGAIGPKTLTLTFDKSGESFAIAQPTDDTQVVVIVNSTGLLLAGAYTYTPGAAGVAPTLVIGNPNIAGVKYDVLVTNLRDSNGVRVTQKSIAITPV